MLTFSLAATTVMVIALGGVSGLTAGQAAAPATTPTAGGHWEGSIQTPGQALEIRVDLARSGDTWEGTIDIPAQGLKAFPLGGIVVQADAVTFSMPKVPGGPEFRGRLSEDGKRLAGDFHQGGQTLPFALTRTGDAKIEKPPASTPVTKELEGSWEGTLDAGAQKLRLLLKLANGAGGGPATGTLVSIDQGNVEIPAAAIVQDGPRLKVLVPSIAGTYAGELKDGLLAGTWTQGPGTYPLTLRKRQP